MAFKQWMLVLFTVALSACGGGSDGGGGSGSGVDKPANFTLQPKAVVLNPSNVNIKEIDATSLLLTGATGTIAAGQILISAEGGGFLRKVVAVTQTADGLKITTEQASLAEAFSNLDIKLNQVFGPNEFGQIIPTGTPELDISFRNAATTQSIATGVEIAGPELSINFNKFGASGNSGVEITGNASFRIAPELDLKLEKVTDSRSILTYRFGMSPNYQHSFDVKTKFGGVISMSESRSIKVGRFLIPGTPIVVIPTLVIEANAKGQAAGAAGASYTASMGGGAYIQRDTNGNTTTGTTYQPLQKAKFDLAESTLAASITPISMKLEFRLYNIAGPNFGFEATGEMSGTLEKNAQTTQEGIRAKVTAKFIGNVGAGGDLSFLDKFVKGIDGGFSIVNVPVKIAEAELANQFFPFSGSGAIKVFDNGAAPDDIFEVTLDSVLLGRTTKGGSGQFRLSSLRPGVRQLTIKTVEDDSPPGTYAIELSDSLTFEDGTSFKSGGLNLGSSVSYNVTVPIK